MLRATFKSRPAPNTEYPQFFNLLYGPSVRTLGHYWVDTYFYGQHGGRGQPTNYQAVMGDTAWLTSEYATPAGAMQHHQFGPFIQPGSATQVSSCSVDLDVEFAFAMALLIEHWPSLKAAAAGGACIQAPVDLEDAIAAQAELNS